MVVLDTVLNIQYGVSKKVHLLFLPAAQGLVVSIASRANIHFNLVF